MPSSRTSQPRDPTHNSYRIQAWPAGSPKLHLLLCSYWNGGFLRLLQYIYSRSVSVNFHFQLHMALSFLYSQTHLLLLPHDKPAHHTLMHFFVQCCCPVCLLSPRASHTPRIEFSQYLPTPLPSLLPQTEAFVWIFFVCSHVLSHLLENHGIY